MAEGDQEMETNMAVEDMCEDEATELKQTMADYGLRLDPK